MVTVWCLAYNHEKYIRQALEGFVNQRTTFKYEVLVHDDASSDSTTDIIKEYQRNYPDIIKPIFQKENQTRLKVNKTKEFLIPNMAGKYVAFCEGDDYWCNSEKLQMQFDQMENNPDASMCVALAKCVHENGNDAGRTIPDISYNLGSDTVINAKRMAEMLFVKGGYPFHTSTFFCRKEILLKLDELTCYMNGDQKILREALVSGNIIYLNRLVSCRRLMSIGSFNARFKEKKAKEICDYYLKEIIGNVLFDRSTSFIFHKQIRTFVSGNTRMIMCRYKYEDSKEYIDEIYSGYRKYLNVDVRILHMFYSAFPNGFEIMLKLLGKLK